MHYISEQDVLVMHARIIEETGGSHGVRDFNLFVSSCNRARMTFDGKELYNDVYKKTAAYLESFIMNHVFVDENKRIGITTSARFLFLNGYELTASNKEIKNFVLNVISNKPDIEKISDWFKKHTKKI